MTESGQSTAEHHVGLNTEIHKDSSNNDRFILLIRGHLKRRDSTDSDPISPSNAYIKKTFTGVAIVENGRYVYPLRETQKNIYDVIESEDGYRVIVVKPGQNIVAATLDDRTALATTDLGYCKGIGLRLAGDEDLYALAHLNYHPERTLREFAKLYLATEVVFSFPDEGNRAKARETMIASIQTPDNPSPTAVEIDHYRGKSGLIITKKGGTVLRQYGGALKPVRDWTWIK